jgi:hypothetical protein
MGESVYVYIVIHCAALSYTVTRWRIIDVAAGSLTTFRGRSWCPASLFIRLEMTSGMMYLEGDNNTLLSVSYLAVENLKMRANELYVNSMLGGNILRLLFPRATQIHASSVARPRVHQWLSSVFPSIVSRVLLDRCGSRRCIYSAAGVCALQEIRYIFLEYFESLYLMWHLLNVRQIMTSDGGLSSLITPTIEAIPTLIYTQLVMHPLSLMIRSRPVPPVLLPAR